MVRQSNSSLGRGTRSELGVGKLDLKLVLFVSAIMAAEYKCRNRNLFWTQQHHVFNVPLSSCWVRKLLKVEEYKDCVRRTNVSFSVNIECNIVLIVLSH